MLYTCSHCIKTQGLRRVESDAVSMRLPSIKYATKDDLVTLSPAYSGTSALGKCNHRHGRKTMPGTTK